MEKAYSNDKKYTLDEYFAIDEASLEKLEFHKGYIRERGEPVYTNKPDYSRVISNLRETLQLLVSENKNFKLFENIRISEPKYKKRFEVEFAITKEKAIDFMNRNFRPRTCACACMREKNF